MTLPSVPSAQSIRDRLPTIFPEGTQERQWCTRDAAVKTIQAMFYAGALVGVGRWLKPAQVVNMSDSQIALVDPDERERWYRLTSANRWPRPTDAWYATNSREQVRDEGVKKGLIPNGAVFERSVPVSSGVGRYAMHADFALLFDDALQGDAFRHAADVWRAAHLNQAALARISLLRAGAVAGAHAVEVRLPSGRSEILSAGESSELTRAVVEQFAPRFLVAPAVIWLSESAQKIIDPTLVQRLGLNIDPAKVLPDVILADLGVADGRVLMVFCEIVHTDGPVTDLRKRQLDDMAVEAGFHLRDVTHVTVFRDRGQKQIRGQIGKLAWDTFVWFASEPDAVVVLRKGTEKKLAALR